MLNMPSEAQLKAIADSGRVPAVAYAYASHGGDGLDGIKSASLAVGFKSTRHTDGTDHVDISTRFPASSLSKIVFTYLILELVKSGGLDLDEPLHNILQYERFIVNGVYPKKAQQLTARHVLSHTTGLPNFGSNAASQLLFSSEQELGQGYSYSGEAFLYLQKVVENKIGKNLEQLAKEYVFDPLGMERSTFLPQPPSDADVVEVHTELGKPGTIFVGEPNLNAAGSLLTTAEDFEKFMEAWVKGIDDPILASVFQSKGRAGFRVCGLGWHLHENEDGELIAYQYGENPNTRALMAINIKARKGAAFFTSAEHGMCLANQILCSPDFAPIGNMQAIFQQMNYVQSDAPGWKETLDGLLAEELGDFEAARKHFQNAMDELPNDLAKQKRLEWFDAVFAARNITRASSVLDYFVGNFTNPYNDKIDIFVRDDRLVLKQFEQEIKLIQISDTEFLPETDQSFKVSFGKDGIKVHSIYGYEKSLSKQPTEVAMKSSEGHLTLCPNYMRHTVASWNKLSLKEKRESEAKGLKPKKLK